MEQICNDLRAELDDLDALVAPLELAQWDEPTPSESWSVRDQLSHLWFFDQRALLALIDPDAFEADKQQLLGSGRATDLSVEPGRAMTSSALLDAWRAGADALIDAARAADPSSRVPWYGPSMAARSFITARLMEAWAHGQDVADAVAVRRVPTNRLRHVAHIGVRARPFSYAIRGREMPEGEVHVVLTPPDGGEPWTWNDPASPHRVTGPAEEFCLLVTQRRHRSDVELDVRGDLADDWLAIAQAFAGAPGPGRPPLGRPSAAP